MKEFFMKHPVATVLLGGITTKLVFNTFKLVAYAITKDVNCLIADGGTISHKCESGDSSETNDDEEKAEDFTEEELKDESAGDIQ